MIVEVSVVTAVVISVAGVVELAVVVAGAVVSAVVSSVVSAVVVSVRIGYDQHASDEGKMTTTMSKGRNKQNIIVLSSFIAIVFIMLLMA